MAVAQDTTDDELVVRGTDDYILDHVEFGFVGANNGEVYHSAKEILNDVEIRFKSPFGE